MYCPRCGSVIEQGDRFCKTCGASLSEKRHDFVKTKKMPEEDLLFRAEDLKEVQALLKKGHVHLAEEEASIKKRAHTSSHVSPQTTKPNRHASVPSRRSKRKPMATVLRDRAREASAFITKEDAQSNIEPSSSQGFGKLVAFVVAFGAVSGVLLGIIFWAIA